MIYRIQTTQTGLFQIVTGWGASLRLINSPFTYRVHAERILAQLNGED